METRLAVTWLLAACVVLAAVPAPVWTGLASARHGSPINATAIWEPTTPGADNATVTAFATAADDADLEGGFEVWENFTTVIPAAIDTATCGPHNARAAGIDRDDDDPGTETDVSMIGRFKYWSLHDNEAGQTVLTIEFYDEDDFGGNSVHLNHTDQIVAKIADCFGTPDEPGWYRNYGHTNGTDWDGEYAETDAHSHWYYFCACDSYDEAVDTLGPPPEAELAQSDGSPGRVEGPYYLSESRTGDGSNAGSPTQTPTPEASPTPTAVATVTEADPTPTPATTRASSSTADDGERASDPPTTESGTATITSSATGPGTTSGGGPGFGWLPALVALLAVAAVGRAR